MNNATRILNAAIETLEDRRLLSSVQLIDGMLIVGGNANGNNRLSITSDPGGQTVFARANDVKGHYLLKDIRQFRVVGGEKNDVVTIDKALKKSAFIRVGSGDDSVTCGSGSDTVFAGNGRDTVVGNGGDDLIMGGTGPNKIDAGAGDNPRAIWIHKNAKNTTSVVSFFLIDANTGKQVAELTNGAVINLAKLPKRLNVIAKVTTGGANGSVRFDYDGNEVRRIENAPPFALAGG